MQGGDLWLSVHHDEDVEIYVNGVLAVHCRQTAGGQYVDVGLVRLVEHKE